jgi:hypothetical protein
MSRVRAAVAEKAGEGKRGKRELNERGIASSEDRSARRAFARPLRRR